MIFYCENEKGVGREGNKRGRATQPANPTGELEKKKQQQQQLLLLLIIIIIK